MPKPTVADVVVIGAGIIGAASAFRLAQRGLSTIVLESAAAPATGSTGRSAAGVRVQFSSETNVLLSWESIQEYRAFEQLYGEDADYRPIGYLFLVPEALREDHLAGLRVQQRLGVPVQLLSVAEARDLIEFDDSGIALATYGPVDGVIDPHRVTLTYLRLAKERGCRVHLETPVLACRREGGTWRIATPTVEFEAPFVINAAGPWAGEVGRRAGLSVPVAPYRRMIFSTTPSFTGASYPLTVDMGTGFYLRSEGQRLLMGRSNPTEPPGFRSGIDWSWLEPLLEAGMARFPWLGEAALDRRASWWGYYEVTPDHSPVLGRMPGAEGWVNACGFSGHGVQQAAAVGRVIAEEVVDGRAHTVNIDPFRYERLISTSSESKQSERHIV